MLLVLLNIVFIVIGNSTTEIIKILLVVNFCYPQKILHLTESCPKNTIDSDFSDAFAVPNILVMVSIVNIPLYKLSSDSALMTLSSPKCSVLIFVLVDKIMPF